MSLTRDQDGNIEIDGVKLFMKDKMTTNGVIHVIGIIVFFYIFKKYCVILL